ncbi:MAG: hypothetical protein ACR2IS_18035 [Nitrososphaeraceae archaeon]
MGLFISKIIIEAHGSSVWAENSSIGKAATFAFSLPIDIKNPLMSDLVGVS